MSNKLNHSHKTINGQYKENKAMFQLLLLSMSIFVFWKESGFLKDEGNFEVFITVISILSFHGSKCYEMLQKHFQLKS